MTDSTATGSSILIMANNMNVFPTVQYPEYDIKDNYYYEKSFQSFLGSIMIWCIYDI